jgi:hypothetical protein
MSFLNYYDGSKGIWSEIDFNLSLLSWHIFGYVRHWFDNWFLIKPAPQQSTYKLTVLLKNQGLSYKRCNWSCNRFRVRLPKHLPTVIYLFVIETKFRILKVLSDLRLVVAHWYLPKIHARIHLKSRELRISRCIAIHCWVSIKCFLQHVFTSWIHTQVPFARNQYLKVKC